MTIMRRSSSRRIPEKFLIAVLVFSLLAPLPAWSASLSLGTARGLRGVEMSLDGGRSWLSLAGRALPILDGSSLRSTTGGALLDLGDGSRVNLMPFTSVTVRAAGDTTEVLLLHGRLGFRLPETTRVEIRTTSATLLPVRERPMVGEVVAAAGGVTGLRMTQGSLSVRGTGSTRVMLASLEPVFLPRAPANARALFSVDATPTPPAGAIGAFNARGESIGYVGLNHQLVIQPGFTADLTQPFPPRLIQVAMARIPAGDRQEATPVFDVNGGDLGYLAGQTFQSRTMVAQAVEGGAGGGTTGEGLHTGLVIGIVAFGGAAGGLGIAALAGAFDSGGSKHAATNTAP